MKSPLFPAALLVAMASTLSACSSAPGQGDEAPATSSVSAAIVVTPKDPCPTVAPRPGSNCTDANLLCSYGEDPRFGCRDVLACNSGKWASVGDACSKNEPSCPRSAPQGPDAGVDTCSAADLGLSCVYDHEAYTCAPCEGNLCFVANHWQTQTLPKACPDTVPNFGEACAVAAGTRCNYNPCANDGSDNYGAAVTCTSGFWTAYTGTICL